MEGLYYLTVAALCCVYPVETDVCIYSDVNTCSNCEDNITTLDIARYLEGLGADKEIKFKLCSDVLPLKSLIAIKDRITFSITGNENGTTIKCEGDMNGLKFVNVTNITLENFKLLNCGAEHNSTSMNISTKDTNLIFKCSVYLLNCSDITMRNIVVRDGDGTGLAIFDGNGNVLIENCTFENNRVLSGNTTTKVLPGGGGLYIEFTYCTPGGLTEHMCNGEANERTQNSTYYIIRQCTFKDNDATTVNASNTSYLRASRNNFQGLGRGGGVCIHFRGQAKYNSINISNCIFHHNSAIWGGGINIAFQDFPASNIVNLEHVNFTNNICSLNGGGGIDVGFLFRDGYKPTNNQIYFYACEIVENSAEYGGGTLLYSSTSSDFTDLGNEIKFECSTWRGNTAIFGAGINIATHTWDTLKRGLLPLPVFIDCTFESNYVINNYVNSIDEHHLEGKAAFITIGVDVKFKGTTTFHNNNGTALYVTSSNAIFAENSTVEFTGNEGTAGGAIFLIGLASIEINDNSVFSFTDNKATGNGGAILQVSYNKNDYVGSKACFIQYAGNKNLTERQIDFIFYGNQAGDRSKNETSYSYGHSIHATTLFPCSTGCLEKTINEKSEVFECFANIRMENTSDYEISTMGEKITPQFNKSRIYVIPGKQIELPINLTDELNNEVSALYHVTIKNTLHSQVSVALEYSYISNKWIKLFGNPGDRANLTIETTYIREVAFTIEVYLQQCPPGFYMKEFQSVDGFIRKYCSCSATHTDKVYEGIKECSTEDFTAKLTIGYWIGYKINHNNDMNGDYGKEENLISGYCPHGFCSNNGITSYTLPNNANVLDLDLLICGKSRTGVLCGRCRGNLSSYYHSATYDCNHSDKCSFGWLFYLLSEIVPVTIFFIIIILFDINFVAGAINGLVFYFQITDSSIIVTNSFIKCPPVITTFVRVYSFLIGIFNLNFFNIDELSFCLWRNAQTLDLLAFKYVTVVYSLLLVVLIIGSLRVCNVRRVTRKFPKLFGREINIKTSVINGLSGFFILFYSDCTKTSLILLTPIEIIGKKNSSTAVLYNGELSYFDASFLLYAIPAILFLVLIGLVPPLLLLSYPLCYKIFGVFKISESGFVRCLCACIPLERLKPFFDSFQCSFKDEFRFFSGLYFIYRLLTLVMFAFTRNLLDFYTMVQLQFLIILCLHAIVQPYKKRSHNILDALIFTNILIINAMTLYNYKRSLEIVDYVTWINTVCTIQAIFLYLPLVCLVLYFCKKMLIKLKGIKLLQCERVKDDVHVNELSESLLLERRDVN